MSRVKAGSRAKHAASDAVRARDQHVARMTTWMEKLTIDEMPC